jgi:hypothetical protein
MRLLHGDTWQVVHGALCSSMSVSMCVSSRYLCEVTLKKHCKCLIEAKGQSQVSAVQAIDPHPVQCTFVSLCEHLSSFQLPAASCALQSTHQRAQSARSTPATCISCLLSCCTVLTAWTRQQQARHLQLQRRFATSTTATARSVEPDLCAQSVIRLGLNLRTTLLPTRSANALTTAVIFGPWIGGLLRCCQLWHSVLLQQTQQRHC